MQKGLKRQVELVGTGGHEGLEFGPYSVSFSMIGGAGGQIRNFMGRSIFQTQISQDSKDQVF